MSGRMPLHGPSIGWADGPRRADRRPPNPVFRLVARTLAVGFVMMLSGMGLALLLDDYHLHYPVDRPLLHVLVQLIASLAALAWLAGLATTGLALTLPLAYDALRGRNAKSDLAWFGEVLADLLEMGVPLHQALGRLASDLSGQFASRYTHMTWAVARMGDDVEAGASLAVAADATGLFPPHWIALCAAGEHSERLVTALRHLAEDARTGASMATRFLHTAVVLLVAFPVAYLIASSGLPDLRCLLEQYNVPLPASTRLLFSLFRHPDPRFLWPVVAPIGVAVLCLGLLTAYRGALPTVPWQTLASVAPLPWQRVAEKARVAGSIAAALRMGLPSGEALAIGALAATSREMKQWLLAASLGTCCSVVSALSLGPWARDLQMAWLVQQGDRFGNLPQAIEAGARYMREEAARQREITRVWLDLGLQVLTGGLVAFIAFAAVQPLAQVIELLEKAVTP